MPVGPVGRRDGWCGRALQRAHRGSPTRAPSGLSHGYCGSPPSTTTVLSDAPSPQGMAPPCPLQSGPLHNPPPSPCAHAFATAAVLYVSSIFHTRLIFNTQTPVSPEFCVTDD